MVGTLHFDRAAPAERSDQDSRPSRTLLSRGRKHTHRYTDGGRYWARPSCMLSNTSSSSPSTPSRKAVSDPPKLRRIRGNGPAESGPLARALIMQFSRQDPSLRIPKQAWTYRMVLPLQIVNQGYCTSICGRWPTFREHPFVNQTDPQAQMAGQTCPRRTDASLAWNSQVALKFIQ